ncbi:serine/threonine-protein kinase [Mycetocola spongiae]|uniref:serine/threonine-protein kinase n=1 Tax=Mycetocola spongiae TaxID=2859226 RepID=UPI001CF391BC|nr:serine/threonine-protein kinase [Mycetocola spongiae]UCR90193.1 serine/threonine protein kinase [Mycetocola spongiae]
MTAHQSIAPPILSGYQHIRVLGRGGFAYVYLYEKDFPRGEVAVKVLMPKIADAKQRAMFLSEANLMSQLKNHPAVLTVHSASIAPDGRPYLVLEYCPSSLGSGYKDAPLGVDEVLRVGIKIGGALETAHRIGFLHRDIKPSNILLTQYGHPVLADFGIAATLAASANAQAEGMSVPWSAPEVLREDTQGTPRSEVYSLAATLFTLLRGRSPFEHPEDERAVNRRERIHARIIGRDRLQPLGRLDVPPELEATLARALSKDPAERPATMLEFVRELQLAEAGLGLVQTVAEIADDNRIEDSRAVLAAPVAEPPRRAGASGAPRRYRHSGSGRSVVQESSGMDSALGDSALTVLRPAGSTVTRSREERRRRTRTVSLIGGIAALAVVATSVGLLWFSRSDELPMVTEISSTLEGGVVVFTWADPGLSENDRYLVTPREGTPAAQANREFRITADGSGAPVCISVAVTRDGKPGPAGPETCAGTR